jgi:riboflavin kinase/FMN adenylyltransferase
MGTKLSAPTINLAPYAELLPPNGVYATQVRIGEGSGAPLLNAVSNVGVRPTFADAGFAVESHLLEGPPPVELTETTPMELFFLRRLREERRFASAEALKAQIQRDVEQAQRYFRRIAGPAMAR